VALTVVTGMWGDAFERYGRAFLDGFFTRWPREVGLVVYSDDPAVRAYAEPAFVVRSMSELAGYGGFMKRHASNPERCGRQPRQGWKDGDRLKGYSFRFDACRFAGQGFALDAAAGQALDGDVLCWLDADVRTTSPVPLGWIEGLLGQDDVAYLGREPKHSEIGFWAVRLSEESRAFLMAFADLYRTDKLFDLREWHSAFAWDDSRRWAERCGLIASRNLTPGGHGHVWLQSPLAEHLDHLKGELRKAKGRSR
jgi:hypothetical protein